MKTYSIKEIKAVITKNKDMIENEMRRIKDRPNLLLKYEGWISGLNVLANSLKSSLSSVDDVRISSSPISIWLKGSFQPCAENREGAFSMSDLYELYKADKFSIPDYDDVSLKKFIHTASRVLTSMGITKKKMRPLGGGHARTMILGIKHK